MNLKDILILHFNIYPEMRPQDAVKLVYQNEFGGGHMIKDKAESLKHLIRELEVTPTNPALPFSHPIGNGLVRINLPTLTEWGITPKELNDAFAESAAKVRGSIDAFKEKLGILKKLVGELDKAPFSYNELSVYLSEYEKSGYPMVSHSSEYKDKYAPAYRIVLEKLLIPKSC